MGKDISEWKKKMLFGTPNSVPFQKKQENKTLEDFQFETKALKMPEEFKGEEKKNGGYTKNNPREWTDAEEKWCLDLRQRGYSIKQIAETVDRDLQSVSIKMKRLKFRDETYNEEHKEEKYSTNIQFLEFLKPKSVLDVYAGEKSFYSSMPYELISNDKNEDFDTHEHLDALKFLCRMYLENKRFDLVDLDPFGSAFYCFDLAIRIAKKGLVITFGEIGNKRWGRLDFVKKCYGIDKIEDFTIENLIEEVIRIGTRSKKLLKVWKIKNWQNISRVYFTIEKYKLPDDEYYNMFNKKEDDSIKN